MRSFLVAATSALLLAALTTAVMPSPVRAMPPFKKAFDAKYVKPDSPDPKHQAFAASVKKVNCNLCHQGKEKKKRNAYGKAVDKHLDKNEKDPVKIEAALHKAAAERSDPDDEDSPTYGELIEQGQLPDDSAAEEADLS